jgi:hypothetical protein
LERFVPYVRARFAEDPHVWASALFDEVVALGYEQSYPSFVRQVRQRALRPHCEACWGVKGRDHADIEHPPGKEIQWDWFERRRAPWGGTAYVLLGPLARSGRVRGHVCESMDQPHLIEAMDAIMRKLGGTARVWRVDRMATVVEPATGDVQAKAWWKPRCGSCRARWWRTLQADSPEQAQVSLDRFCTTIADARLRPPGRYVDPDELDSVRPAHSGGFRDNEGRRRHVRERPVAAAPSGSRQPETRPTSTPGIVGTSDRAARPLRLRARVRFSVRPAGCPAVPIRHLAPAHVPRAASGGGRQRRERRGRWTPGLARQSHVTSACHAEWTSPQTT